MAVLPEIMPVPFVEILLAVVLYANPQAARYAVILVDDFINDMLCGMAVGLMWPGTISIASQRLPRGGTAMFAFLALAGDLGATVSSVLVGSIAERFEGNLKAGLLVGTIFPIVLVWGLMRLKRKLRRSNHEISGNSCS